MWLWYQSDTRHCDEALQRWCHCVGFAVEELSVDLFHGGDGAPGKPGTLWGQSQPAGSGIGGVHFSVEQSLGPQLAT